jgi:DNA-binding GntR family transcriptional regulator
MVIKSIMSATLKSMQIVQAITKEIEQQILVEGDKLPTEQELSVQYQVSRETVRKALKKLIETGGVYSI